MAFGYDGSVRIKADLNHSPFDRGLSSMTKQVNTFGNTLKKIGGLVAMAFGTAALVNFAKESVKAASALNDAWLGLESIVEGQGKSFSKAKSFINDYISDGLVPLENAVTSYKNLAARGYTTDQIENVMNALKDSAAFGRQSSYTLGEAVQTATEGLKNENSILVDNAGVTKNVAKMWDEYAKSIGTTANKLTQEQKIQAEVNGILQETRFQTGDAAKLVNTYSGQISLLGYNFQNLKVQVGNALIPIAQAVLPGINAIIAGLTKLAKVFAQVTALLFGKSPEVKTTSGIAASAGAAADATDKLAESTAGAGSAAKQAEKDMKGVLASFDELNILANRASDSVGGAGGGGGAGAGASDLEIPSYESEIEQNEKLGESYETLGELFMGTIDKILESLPELREALLEAAKNFNEFNQKLYDAFTMPGLKEKVQQLGRELADIMNEFVDAIDWELWGRALGAGLNLALNFLTSFLYEFNWVNLGKHLAELINGLVYEIDWYEFGRLLWVKFKIALETFAGFLLGLDMPALAQAASNIVKGFFNSMQESIANIDWAGIGRQIAEFLNNIDWIGVINSIAGAIKEMVGAALEMLGGFISEADPEILIGAAILLGGKLLGGIISKVVAPIARQVADNLIKNIASAITGGDAGGISAALGGILKNIAGVAAAAGGSFLAVSNFLEMLSDGFNWVNEALMLLGIAVAAVGAVILGVPATVAATVAVIVAAVATAVVVIKEHWEEIGEFFGQLWENAKAGAKEALDNIKEYWSGVGEWWDDNFFTPVGDFFNQLGEDIADWASDTWLNVQSAWENASAWFDKTIIQPLSEGWDKFWDDLGAWASETWSNVKSAWDSASTWFDENVVQPASKAFDQMWSDISEWASDTWSDVKIAWDSAGKWFEENVTNPIGKFFDGLWDGIKKAASDAWANIKQTFSNVGSWFESNVSSKFRSTTAAASSPRMVTYSAQNMSTYSLPRLANGAVIPPNQQFAAILGDQRSGKNLEAPTGLIRQIVQEGMQAAMAQGGFNRGGNMTVIMEIDGREFGRASYRYGIAEQQRVGVRLAEVRA